MHHPRVVLIGPQRLRPTLDQAVRSLGVEGRIAAVTAGWEEREDDDRELREHLWGRTVNLQVWARVEQVMAKDGELRAALVRRADRLREQHELHRLRLGHALAAARELLARAAPAGAEALLEAERAEAIEELRRLDAFQLSRVSAIHAEFEARWKPLERAAVVRQRRELATILSGTGALCVAGGHLTVLLHRLRLLGVLELIGAQPIVAWSAGAMALSERVVLFHDSPPQGAGDAELHEQGLGAFPGVVALPHAQRRLRLHDAARVALMARRFAPAACLALDPLTRADCEHGRWRAQPGTLRLHESGALRPMGEA